MAAPSARTVITVEHNAKPDNSRSGGTNEEQEFYGLVPHVRDVAEAAWKKLNPPKKTTKDHFKVADRMAVKNERAMAREIRQYAERIKRIEAKQRVTTSRPAMNALVKQKMVTEGVMRRMQRDLESTVSVRQQLAMKKSSANIDSTNNAYIRYLASKNRGTDTKKQMRRNMRAQQTMEKSSTLEAMERDISGDMAEAFLENVEESLESEEYDESGESLFQKAINEETDKLMEMVACKKNEILNKSRVSRTLPSEQAGEAMRSAAEVSQTSAWERDLEARRMRLNEHITK